MTDPKTCIHTFRHLRTIISQRKQIDVFYCQICLYYAARTAGEPQPDDGNSNSREEQAHAKQHEGVCGSCGGRTINNWCTPCGMSQ